MPVAAQIVFAVMVALMLAGLVTVFVLEGLDF